MPEEPADEVTGEQKKTDAFVSAGSPKEVPSRALMALGGGLEGWKAASVHWRWRGWNLRLRRWHYCHQRRSRGRRRGGDSGTPPGGARPGAAGDVGAGAQPCGVAVDSAEPPAAGRPAT